MLLKVKNAPFCISIEEAWIQFGFIYIQTELCSRGRLAYFLIFSLSTYLNECCDETPLAEDVIWKIMADIIQVRYCN